MALERATELIQEIGGGLLRDTWLTEEAPDWESLSLSVILAPGVSSMSGYTYRSGAAPEPGTPNDFDLHDLFKDLQAAMLEANPRPWVACLTTIVRDGLKIHMDYEYDDPARWKVTPQNLATLPEAMRPQAS